MIVFAIAFIEACVGVGVFVSGAILLSVCTYLCVENVIAVEQLVPLAFLGAALGDHSGYYIGRLFGPRFHETKLAIQQKERIARVQEKIVKYGSLTILFGRLMTPIRSVVPLLVGVSGMPNAKYTFYDLLACLIWSIGLWLSIMGMEKLWHQI